MSKLPYERPVIQKLNSGTMNKFGTRTEYAPVTHVDGVAVKDIIREFGSPCFVLSERQIRKNYQGAVRAFKTRYPKVQFAWSYKTNYLNAVCNVFHQEGAWAEVVSGFEYCNINSLHLSSGIPQKNYLPDREKNDPECQLHWYWT
jgi:diaminopimelate decarboxylase